MISRNALLCAIAIASSFNLTASALGQEEAERPHAAMGQTVRLEGHVNYARHCTEVIPTAISVVQAPQHGTLEVRGEVVRSAHPELGHGSKCAGASGMGKVVYYTRTSQGATIPARARVPTFSPMTSVSSNDVVHFHVTVQ